MNRIGNLNGRLEQLWQLACGIVWDGDLISKDDRNGLVEAGFAGKEQGFNFITAEGIRHLIMLGILRETPS